MWRNTGFCKVPSSWSLRMFVRTWPGHPRAQKRGNSYEMLGRSLHQCVHVVPVNRPHLKPERRNHPRPANADSVPDVVEPKLFKKLSLTSRARNALLKCLTEFSRRKDDGARTSRTTSAEGYSLDKIACVPAASTTVQEQKFKDREGLFLHFRTPHAHRPTRFIRSVASQLESPRVVCCVELRCQRLLWPLVLHVRSSEATFTPLKTLQASCLATCLQHPGIKTSAFLQLVTRQ